MSPGLSTHGFGEAKESWCSDNGLGRSEHWLPRAASETYSYDVTTTDNIALAALIFSLLSFAFTIFWSRKSDAEKWRRDAVAGALSRIILNSTWLTEVGRDAFERLQNTQANAPISDAALRADSDRYRYGLGIEYSLFDVYYSQSTPVRVALTSLYETHRTIRRAIFNADAARRDDAWKEILGWGIDPSVQVTSKVTSLHDELLQAVQKDLKIKPAT